MASSEKKKGLLRSKTVGGALVAAIPAIEALLLQFGVLEQPELSTGVAAIFSGVGALIAVYGRIQAKIKLSGIF